MLLVLAMVSKWFRSLALFQMIKSAKAKARGLNDLGLVVEMRAIEVGI